MESSRQVEIVKQFECPCHYLLPFPVNKDVYNSWAYLTDLQKITRVSHYSQQTEVHAT